MKKIYAAENLIEAHLLLDMLAHAGINAYLLNENAQGGVGEIPFTHAYPEIWVKSEHDVERGKRLISEYEQLPVNTGVVFCKACGEENPRNFQLCWNCGAGLEHLL